MAPAVTLSQTHPTISGRRNSYRERWALVDGLVYHVSADWLDAPWTVETDTEAMTPQAALEFVQSDEYKCEIVFTLTEAREVIARWAAELEGN